MSDAFDTAALHQWSEQVWLDDSEKRYAIWAQMLADMAAAAQYIDELEDKLAEATDRRGPEA